MTGYLHKSATSYPVYRIRAGETNRFVMLVNPLTDACNFIQVLEIFDVGGSTPINHHRAAQEVFYVLHGLGEASTDLGTVPLQPGTALLLQPGVPHAVRNTGSTRLYCLTTMVPDEDFARLISDGVPDALDAQDLAVLGW